MKYLISTLVAGVSWALFCPYAVAFTPRTCKSFHSIQAHASSTCILANRRDFGASFASILGGGLASIAFPDPASAEPRPMYLTEPTDEFKANEAKAMDFKRQQLSIKKEFTGVLDSFLSRPNDTDALVKDLNDLKGLVAKTGGLPLGIKKEELYKSIRSKKAKGFWPTPVEIAYQSLIQEISFQQSPNLDKDLGNPYQ